MTERETKELELLKQGYEVEYHMHDDDFYCELRLGGGRQRVTVWADGLTLEAALSAAIEEKDGLCECRWSGSDYESMHRNRSTTLCPIHDDASPEPSLGEFKAMMKGAE